MSQKTERSLVDVLLEIVFKKFPDMVKEDDIHSIEFIKKFLQDAENIDFFLESIKMIYSKENYPHYNLAPILSIIAEILNRREEPLKSKLYNFTLELLDSSIENLKILGFDIFSENRKLFWDKRKKIYSKILTYWDSPNEKLKAEAIYSLESYVYVDFRYFSPHFNRLKKVLIETENDLVTIVSTLILGLIYLYNHRNSVGLSLNNKEVNIIIAKYKLLDTIQQKTLFLNGLHLLLLEYGKYESNWIEFFLNEYIKTEDLYFKFKLLSDIASFPNNKEFKEEDIKKYYNFFHNLLENLLKKDFDKPPPSVLVRPNLLQDILHNTEQLTFYLPKVVEKLLPLYEKVYLKYVLEQVNSGLSFERLAHQWIQEIYIILSEYYIRLKNNQKISFYYKKTSDYAFNKKDKLGFLIKHFHHKIVYQIINNDFNEIKPIFNELNEIYIEYEKNTSELYPYSLNWVIFEDLIYLFCFSDNNYQREYRNLRNDLSINKDKISIEIFDLLNKIGLIKGKELDLRINILYSEYCELKTSFLKHILNILEKTLKIPVILDKKEKIAIFQNNPLISEFEQIQKSFRSKIILILGQDTTEKHRLTSIKECLNQLGYEGIIIKELKDNTEVTKYQSIENKVSLYAQICRFVIVENSIPSGHIDELKICEINKNITVILQQKGYGATFMQDDYSFEHNYIKKFPYLNIENLCGAIKEAVEWVDYFIEERKKNYQTIYPWRE